MAKNAPGPASVMTQLSGPAFDGLYGQLILEHYRNPRNRDPLACATVAAYELNPFCGDLIDLQLRLDGSGVVEAVFARSEGCSIIQASASMMSEAVKGQSVAGLMALSGRFRALLRARPGDSGPPLALGDLDALSVVRQYPVRIKCALLPWVALEEAFRERPPAAP